VPLYPVQARAGENFSPRIKLGLSEIGLKLNAGERDVPDDEVLRV